VRYVDEQGNSDSFGVHSIGELTVVKRNLHPSPLATTAELVERIKANLRIPRS
jgi:hypothetical protein